MSTCSKDYKQRELQNCSFIKTVLMFLIVLYHSILFWNGNWFTILEPERLIPAFNTIAIWLSSFHVYGFTLISGYIFYYVKYERGGYPSLYGFLKKKVCRLIIPYVVFSCIWVMPISQLFYGWSWKTIVVNYVLGTNPGQLWFLLMLFGTLIILFLLSDLMKKNMFCGLMISMSCYVVGCIGNCLIPNCFQVWTALEYLPFAAIGFMIRQYNSTKLYRIPSIVFLAVNILCLYLSKNIQVSNALLQLLSDGLSLFAHIFGAMWVFIFCQNIGNKINWKENRIITFLSERSMTVYLVHQQIIFILLYALNGRVSPYILWIVVFFVTMTVSLLIASLLKRHKVTRILIGE